MKKYKIIENPTPNGICTSILNKDTGVICPQCKGNKEYDQFIRDVKEQGIDIVEGEDVVTVVTEEYATARKKAYGAIEDQLDKIYHKGLDVWKSDILAIKDAIPKTQEYVTSISVKSVPDWVQTEADNYSP
tara:strand:+ start:284 stop:676 length:393 start_codon:yes stop_codon:yes gene_type:complete